MSFYFRDEVLPYYGGGTALAREVKGNDFMYRELMRRSAERGVRVFDYGRSKRDTGSYSFKKKWGFEPEPLHNEYVLVKASRVPDVNQLNPKYQRFINIWKRLPLGVTRVIGLFLVLFLGCVLLVFLFLAHRIPYPPNKGDKLRSFNLIKQLGRDYRVHLGAFIDDAHDWKYVDDLRAMCGECHFVPLDPPMAKLRSLSALFGGRPLSLPYYRDAGMMRWVQGILRERPVRQVLVYSCPMAQYVKRTDTDVRRVMDFVDVDSDKWRQYAEARRWPMSWVYRREARTLLRYERRIAAAFDASVFVSDSEAALFRRLAPECTPRVWGIHNGVDTAYFDPAQTFAAPYPLYEKPIVFTGAMDYWANVEAVVWFARKVLPIVREADEEARFYIVGARPAAEVKELRRLPGVVVVGAVEDIRPYIAHAALAVAPLRIARGVQNKVLETMPSKACGVTTTAFAIAIASS